MSKNSNKVKELEKVANEGIEKLYNELKEGKTENLENYFRAAGKLRYSPFNLYLIFTYCPNATCVKTFVAWNKLGYRVNKGEKGIPILQPKPYKYKKNKKIFNDFGEEEEKEVEVSHLYFKVLHLYDISQVTKVDPNAPDVEPNIVIQDNELQQMEGDFTALYQQIKEVIIDMGISVLEMPVIKGNLSIEGASFGGKIQIKKASSGNMLTALLHEWAHEILHHGSENKKYSTQEKECHAEATAYIVANALNVYSPFSKDYILGWGNTVDDFKKNLDIILKAVNKILIAIESYNNPEVILETA